MKKEEIVALGVAEDVAQKIIDAFAKEIDGEYVPKQRFNEVNEAKKNAEALVKERDGQLETLKASAGDSEALKKQIEELQEANENTVKEHEAQIKQMKIDNAVEKAITEHNGKNVTAIKALLNLQDAKLEEDGTVKGLKEQLEALTKAENSSFLFGSGIPEIKGMVPAAGQQNPGTSNADLSKMSYEQLCKYMEANPDVKIS